MITKALLTHFACETCVHFSPVTEVVSFRLSDLFQAIKKIPGRPRASVTMNCVSS